MSKQLISLISTNNKTPEQVAKEAMAALKKYFEVYNKALEELTKDDN